MYQIGYKIIDKKCQFPILAKAGIEVKAVEQLWESNIFYPYTCTFSYSFQIQRLISSSKSPECLAYFWAGEENLLKILMLYCITLQLIHLQPNQSELWNQVGLVSKVNERKPAAFGRFESLQLSNNASAKGITSHKRQKKRKVFKGHSDNFHLLSLFSSYFSFTRQSKALWKLKKKSVRRHTPKVVPTQTSVEASLPFLTQLFFHSDLKESSGSKFHFRHFLSHQALLYFATFCFLPFSLAKLILVLPLRSSLEIVELNSKTFKCWRLTHLKIFSTWQKTSELLKKLW